mmetsp:Transcript_12919/g.33652  ORF Transcript_12919/g.33652 Transcript_12919/m.33652 type:complete len:204 (+) Transcript_12919:24-635(+)
MRLLRPVALGRAVAAPRGSGVMSDPVVFEPHLDPSAGIVAVVILTGALALRLKIDGAIAAREAADAARAKLQAARVSALEGSSDAAQLERLVDVVQQVDVEAERARTINVLGLGLRFMVPLPLGARAPGATAADTNSATRGPDTLGDRAQQNDRADGQSRWPRGATLAVIAIVMTMQLALLTLLATDPMASTSVGAARLPFGP